MFSSESFSLWPLFELSLFWFEFLKGMLRWPWGFNSCWHATGFSGFYLHIVSNRKQVCAKKSGFSQKLLRRKRLMKRSWGKKTFDRFSVQTPNRSLNATIISCQESFHPFQTNVVRCCCCCCRAVQFIFVPAEKIARQLSGDNLFSGWSVGLLQQRNTLMHKMCALQIQLLNTAAKKPVILCSIRQGVHILSWISSLNMEKKSHFFQWSQAFVYSRVKWHYDKIALILYDFILPQRNMFIITTTALISGTRTEKQLNPMRKNSVKWRKYIIFTVKKNALVVVVLTRCDSSSALISLPWHRSAKNTRISLQRW